MKFAIIGSYGHYGVFLDGVKSAGGKLATAARFGPADALGFVGRHECAPAGTAVYDDYRRMLDEVRPEVVGVFVPLYRIAECCRAAAERSCHIFTEKPLALTLEDLADLRAAVATAGVEVAACLTTRAEGPFQAARQAVKGGRIGEPVLAFAQKSYPFDRRDDYFKKRETYGGSIPWQAIHAIDFVSYCCGKGFIRAAAMNSNAAHPSHPGMEDNGGILLEFAGGGHAVICFDYFRPWSQGRIWGDDRLRIAGTQASVEVVEEGQAAVLATPAGVERLTLPAKRDFFGEFIEGIRAGGMDKLPDPIITTAESFRATEVALLARDAADRGEIVQL